MPGRFDGIDAKIERADKHGLELKEAVKLFLESAPYDIFSYCQLESRGERFAVHVKAEPPASLGAIAGDLINNLRSALDYVVCELYRANGFEPGEHTYFPIKWTASQVETTLAGIEEKIGKDAANLIQASEPYKGGAGHGLWQLHQLNRRDKHRLLLAVGSSYEEFAFRPNAGFPFIHLKPEGQRIYPLEDGTVIFGKPADADMDLKFGFNVVLSEPGIVDGELLLPELARLFTLVTQTVKPFRAILR